MYRDISVLLVEDNQALARIADMKLSAKHFQVTRAVDRLSAIDMISEANILVVDLNLPNGDGRDLLRLWAKRLDVGPAMVITGYSVADDEVPEAWVVLRKPFDMDRLVDMCERFAQVVRGTRCCREVGVLKKRMTLMWVAIAALGGVEVVLPVAKFIADLIPLGGFLP